MNRCNVCDCCLGSVHGRVLKDALTFTKASKPRESFDVTSWVAICPECDAYALGAETEHPWPYMDHSGVMRVVNDGGEPVLDLFGFLLTESALQSSHALWLRSEGGVRDSIEAMGGAISKSTDDDEVLDFSRRVCEWGRGQRVWANLLRQYEGNRKELAEAIRSWLIFSRQSLDLAEAVDRGAEIKGLGVSFASKHLRMLDPNRFGVLDDVLQQGLGIALNPRGYQLFMSGLASLNERLDCSLRMADLEGAVFSLVRQTVRARG